MFRVLLGDSGQGEDISIPFLQSEVIVDNIIHHFDPIQFVGIVYWASKAPNNITFEF